jgi:hypothetical protein
MRQVAVPPPAIPRETVIHNHNSSSNAPVFLVLFGIACLTVVFGWYGGVFLLAQAGLAQPERQLANGLIFVVGLLVVLAIATLVARAFLRDVLEARVEIERLRTQAEQARQNQAQQISPLAAARMTREQSRLYMAVKLAMSRAYQSIDEQGNLQTRAEPWSRRSVGELRLLNESKALGEQSNVANAVKPWLLRAGILVDDRTVNLADYPNLNAVDLALLADFGPPVLYRPDSPTGDFNARFEHI